MDPVLRMKNLVDSSHDIDIDINIPISRYFKSSRELVKSAITHQESGDIEKAFVLYMRHMSLILEKLPRHPEWNQADPTDKKHVKNQCNIIFDLAEKLKSKLKQKFDEEYQISVDNKTDTSKQRVNISETTTKGQNTLDEIDRKFNFKNESVNKEENVLEDLFDLDKLKESLSSTK